MNISFKVKTPYTRSWLPTIHCGFVDTFHAAMNALESHLFAHMSFASPVELNGILLRPSSGEKSHLLLLFQLCFPFGYVRSIFILSIFIMTKRDSYIADLPSPRVLRMASSDIDMSNAGPHSTRHLHGFSWSGFSSTSQFFTYSSISTLYPCSATPASKHYASKGSSATHWPFYPFQGDRTSLALRTPVHLGPCGGDGCTGVHET